jgi:hypothetical protein
MTAFVETPELVEDGFEWAIWHTKMNGKLVEYTCSYASCPGEFVIIQLDLHYLLTLTLIDLLFIE